MLDLKNKKVLVFGLGILGGGVEAVKWFYKNKAKIKITDLKSKKYLFSSLKKLSNIKAKYILGKHRYEDIDWSDIVYVNPGVSYKNPFVEYAFKGKKEVVNDCYLFFKYAKGEIIAITGTRGKTTTITWVCELLKRFFNDSDLKNFLKFKPNKKILIGGNQPNRSLFKILEKTNSESISVLEVSSFQLEFYKKGIKAPKIAVITGLLNDHLNRYSNMAEYARAKANIFLNQTKNDFLILNYDNSWTNYFLSLKPKSQVYFVSSKKLPSKMNGIYFKKDVFYIRDKKEMKFFSLNGFKDSYGEHNVLNLLFSILTVYLYLKNVFEIEFYKFSLQFKEFLSKNIFSLKTPSFRQELVYKSKFLEIINDSASTTPDATLAALRRYAKKKLVIITGGTDKKLDFKNLAKQFKKQIDPQNCFLLNGTATQKFILELKKNNYQLEEKNICEDLKECVIKVLKRAKELRNKDKKGKIFVLFSPASASFEKFKNEFDRGKKFNKLIKYFFKISS